MSRRIESVSGFLVLVSVVVLASMPALAQGSKEAITLYQLPNGGGAGQDIPVGTYRVSGKRLATGNSEAVFSVRVTNGFRVRFCDDDGQAGKTGGSCEEFGRGTHDLRSLNFTFIKIWAEVDVK